MANIMVVDDDESMCAAFRQFLTEEGHSPNIVSNAQDAVRGVVESRPDLIFMDIRMPGTDGLEALHRMRQVDPDIQVVIMTAYGTSQTSIEAVRLGAFDYLMKPLDLDDVKVVIDKALEAQKLSREVTGQPSDDWGKYSLINLVGKSSQMQEAYKLIGLLTTNDVPALIVGERGTGKQTVAHTIHANSNRKDKAFVVVNCAALAEPALENELFGHEGTASGATHAVIGKVESAGGGTLYLENIADMPRSIQNKVARFVTDRTFEKPGTSGRLRADTRVIASTDRDLVDEVREGRFLPQLYDALRVISIQLPPLRSRRDDIPELVEYFIKRFNMELGKTVRGVDDKVKQMLHDHDWSSNVTELETTIKRACILARGTVITMADVGDSLRDAVLPGSSETQFALDNAVRKALQQRLVDSIRDPEWSVFHEIVTHVEESLVREALAITGGNQVKAAEILGLNRTTLRKKMNLSGE